jgi:RHS repeat-associated protein
VVIAGQSFAYDAVGNRTDAGSTVAWGNRLTAMGGWSIAYDSLGNMISRTNGGETLTYKWNALGQLDTVVAPSYTVAYGYDGLGRRVRKTVNGVSTRYLVEGDRVLAELDNGWAVAAKYSYLPGVDRPLAMQRGGATYYYMQDAQGNVTGLLNATGGVVQQYHYAPYGEAQGGYGNIVNPYQYKGREWDAEARLYFMRARYYDPQLGRFISEDPIGLAGGINPMAFVSGDPVNFSDPTGLKECTAAELADGRHRQTIQSGQVICVLDFVQSIVANTSWATRSPRIFSSMVFSSRPGFSMTQVGGPVMRANDGPSAKPLPPIGPILLARLVNGCGAASAGFVADVGFGLGALGAAKGIVSALRYQAVASMAALAQSSAGTFAAGGLAVVARRNQAAAGMSASVALGATFVPENTAVHSMQIFMTGDADGMDGWGFVKSVTPIINLPTSLRSMKSACSQ